MNPIEPHSDMRQAAAMHRQLYLAEVEVGFSEEQALRPVLAFIDAT